MRPLLPSSSVARFLLIGLLSLLLNEGFGQSPGFDSSYYITYPKQVTGRFFFSKKYTGPVIDAPQGIRSIRYRPNTSFSTGIGATYGILTLNLGLNLGFLNPNKKEKGKTNSLDLQSHIYARKWVADLYGQFYRGYYLAPKGFAAPDEQSYYHRRDLRVELLGASAYRLLNPTRFSYRAAFLQNEWQVRPAGTWLLGLEIYHGTVKADSAMVPNAIASIYAQQGIEKLRFTEFGPGVGYAYTYVLQKNFFATGSITVNADLGFTREFIGTTADSRTTISPNATLRAVAGYNSDSWIATLSWVDNNISVKGASGGSYLIRTGNFRVTIAKRFRPGKKLRKKLEVIDELPISP